MKNTFQIITMPDGSAVAKIALTKGYSAIIDVDDLPLVGDWNWQAAAVPNGRTYVRGSRGKVERVWMHRLILPGGHEVKHWDEDGLNNRRGNLVPAERSDLCHARRKKERATSRFRGVSWDKVREKWKAQITPPGGRPIFIGRFENEEDAAAAYDEAAARAYGALAKLNAENASFAEVAENIRRVVGPGKGWDAIADPDAYIREMRGDAPETASSASPDDIRALGWSVAVHNDYRQDGQAFTFWLFTRENKCVKGEGETDAEALDQVRKQIARNDSGCRERND